jgi:putative membrane protein
VILRDALAAYAHYAAILLTTIALGSELVLYRRALSSDAARTLQRVDVVFGLAAAALIVTGIGRIFASAKGWAFYVDNPVFWIKMALFLTVGILSIWPTLHFLSWRRTALPDGSVAVASRDFARIRGFLIAEVVVLFSIPLFASLMARGIGLH